MSENQKDNIKFGVNIAKLTVYEEPRNRRHHLGLLRHSIQYKNGCFTYVMATSLKKFISEYHFGLIERPSEKLLLLEGFNTYTIDKDIIARRIDYKPLTHMFFALPVEEFRNLSQQHLQERVLNQLVEFTKSTKYQNSFLSKGNSIRISFAGEIWLR